TASLSARESSAGSAPSCEKAACDEVNSNVSAAAMVQQMPDFGILCRMFVIVRASIFTVAARALFQGLCGIRLQAAKLRETLSALPARLPQHDVSVQRDRSTLNCNR